MIIERNIILCCYRIVSLFLTYKSEIERTPMRNLKVSSNAEESDGDEEIIPGLPNIDDYSIHTYDESSDGTTSISDSSEVSSSSSKASIGEAIRKFFHREKKPYDNDLNDSGSSFSVFRHHHRKGKSKNVSGRESNMDSQFAQGTTNLQDDESQGDSGDGSSCDDLFERRVDNDADNESPLTPIEGDCKPICSSIDHAKFFYDAWSLLTQNEITLETLGNNRPDEYLLTCIVTLQKEYEMIRSQNAEYKEELLQRTTKMEALKSSNERKINKLKNSYEKTIEKYIKKLEISEEFKEKEIEKGVSDFGTINAGLESRNKQLEETVEELEMRNQALDEKVTNLAQVLNSTSRSLIVSEERAEKFENALQSSKEKFSEIQTEIERSYQALKQMKTKYEFQHNKSLSLRKEILFFRRLTEFFEICLRESLSFMGYIFEAFKGKFKPGDLNELNEYFAQMNKITELKSDLINAEAEVIVGRFQEAEELLYNFYTMEAKTKFVEPLLMHLTTTERSVTFLTNKVGECEKKISVLKAYIKRKKASLQSSAENSYNYRTLTNVNHTEISNL